MHNPRLKEKSENWLVEATILDMQQEMEAGEVTSRDLVLMYLSRIANYDKNGPTLNSVLEINPDALSIADALDWEREQHGPRGPLHGIPVLLKDNIDTGDNMHTSAGSQALANNVAAQDSYVAAQLRRAGAVLLGKANMTEWANYMALDMPGGYSSRGGQVVNAYCPDFQVSGSSSGSAVSVSANLAAAAVGSETSGSIISPAGHSSIVGIKPTLGLISRTGIIPISHSQDTAGPMARTVTDAALLLGAMTGIDENDAATRSSLNRSYQDYTPFLQADGLRGARIGIPRHYYAHLNEEEQTLMQAVLDVLAAEGATVVDDVQMPASNIELKWEVLAYDFKVDLNAYLRRLSPNVPVHSLAELIAYNNERPEAMLKYGQYFLENSEATSGTLTEPDYIAARERDLYVCRELGIDHALRAYQLDALLTPQSYLVDLAARAGYPSISVPAGRTSKCMFGVTFTASAYSEPTLLRLAYAFEQATKHRIPPEL